MTQHFRPRNNDHKAVVPGVFFMYDLSPIMMRITESEKSFMRFLTNLCAIVGGVFTIAGIADQILYRAIEKFKTKPI